MPAKKVIAAKRETLNVRIKPEDRSLIDRAAHLAGKSRTDFLLEAARRAAEDALLDQTLFKINPTVYANSSSALMRRQRRTQGCAAP